MGAVITNDDIRVWRIDQEQDQILYSASGFNRAWENPRVREALERAKERGVKVELA